MKNRTLDVQGVEVTLERKSVKNINLAVYPPDGRVRVSAPRHLSEEQIRSVIVGRLEWIKAKQAGLLARPLQPSFTLAEGERLRFLGEGYVLQVIERAGRPGVALVGERVVLQVRPGTDVAARMALIDRWYRKQLTARIPDLLDFWQPRLGVEVREWRIRRMKSRWGTCNISDRRIWLNLELAKLAPSCLEYVVVHEMVHLLERRHNSRFWGLMDKFLPGWRAIRQELKIWSLG